MSVEIHQYLDNSGGNNFTESAPRPPVGPGEENELLSNGGHSNKSSSSHKSHTSNKSNGSAGAATPRRSQKTSKVPPASSASGDKTQDDEANTEDDSVAPLGFEPEGSVDASREFNESTPAYIKWAESLDYLLEDAEGVSEFKKFLAQENNVNLFEFYFAWKYLQELDAEEMKQIGSLIKTMYKVFIKGDKGDKKLTCIPANLRESTAKLVTSKQYSKSIFNNVRNQVVHILQQEFYQPFLKSEIYLQYVHKMEDSPKESAHSSGSPCTMSAILPTVHEDSELDLNTISGHTGDNQSESSSNVTLSLTIKNIRMTERLRQDNKIKPEDQAGFYLKSSSSREDVTPPHPYHTHSHSYNPISAIDSERQSLSSECLTDDTHSVTDSSLDGFPQYSNKRSVHRYYKKLKHTAQRNPESQISNQQFVPPKSQRMSKISNLAETNAAEFARILSEKLQKVLDEINRGDMMRSKLSAMSEDECTDDSRSIFSSTTGGNTSTNPLNQLLVAMSAGDHDTEPQDILDMHCKRIWENTGQHTPSKSPRSKSPEHFNQIKKIHTLPRNALGVVSRQPPPSSAGLLSKSTNSSYTVDNSYAHSTSLTSGYQGSKSRQGLATFSSRAEQQSILKPPPNVTNHNQKVYEWINRNEEFNNSHGPADSDKSSFKRSQRSGSTTASPKVTHRNKSHGKSLGEVKRVPTDDKYSQKSKSSSSSQKERRSLSRSSGEPSTGGPQTLTQRKGIPVPPQTKVAFFLPDEPIPYSVTVLGTEITLSRFKELITKKGNYRYFFKKATDEEFGRDVPYVLEEITSDHAILPKWELKVVGYVKKVES